MPRDVDPKRTRKALRQVRKLAEATPAEAYSGWEADFLKEVGERLETYGSAFRDTKKGAPEEALSTLQRGKLREIAAKAKGKAKRAKADAAPESSQDARQRKPLGWRTKARPRPPRDRDDDEAS